MNLPGIKESKIMFDNMQGKQEKMLKSTKQDFYNKGKEEVDTDKTNDWTLGEQGAPSWKSSLKHELIDLLSLSIL